MPTRKLWRAASAISVLFVLAMKEPRVTPELIWMPQNQQQLMKLSLQKKKNHALNVVDHIFRTSAGRTKVTPTASSRTTRKLNNSHKFNLNNCNSSQFPTGTLSFQALKQIYPGDTFH